MKINYQENFVEFYKSIRTKNKGELPKILLHVCCGACSCYPLVFLTDLFEITILFTNSNIETFEEFTLRYEQALKHGKIVEKTFKNRIKFIKDEYNYDDFSKDLEAFKDEPEGGKRCKICITKRLARLYDFAKENGFEYVSTIMSISRNKDAIFINEVGLKMEKMYPGIKFVTFDFKKNNGQDIGVEISKIEDLYRQEFCGCEFSKH